ncbi:hydantoinase/oxoprolinase family protein [Acuticoccus sp.]|uniref:hydantoinase/oxoprolinase family protein n=1 Tax=Acuticoccus sp. TaxID=1904378 RepID=UPI003B51A53D
MTTDRVGVEIGGTFTDLVWRRGDGTLVTHKVLSTPKAIHEAVANAIDGAGADPSAIDQLVHGSTVATNALLTRDGSRTALITTRGFRDVIEIGTHERTGSVYEVFYRKPVPPVPRRLVLEVDERIDPTGTIVRPLDRAAVEAVVDAALAEGVGSIAIALLHAYANPAHERELAAIVRARAPEVVVSASHEISPEFREYERTMTTVVNAFVSPVVSRYVERIEADLRARGYGGILQIMQSNGGVMPGASAARNAVRMLLSGPAAGVRAAMFFAERNGIDDVLTIDMGGTSTDVVIAPGRTPTMVPELKVDGLPIRTPAVDMVTVGAGGGSIAALDPGGLLAVGPASAGADPGPAAYGRGGTKATVTDAQLVAGLLRPDRFFGGRMTLDARKAADALAAVGMPGSPQEVADAVLRIVNTNMAQALRRVSTARGIDPSGYTLVAYGGGGPLHAATVAEEIGVRRVLVPWAPGLASAFGLLVADTTIDLVRTDLQVLSDATLDAARLAELNAWAGEAAAAHGLAGGEYTTEVGLDMRYRGQAFELTVWSEAEPRSADALRAAFEAAHLQRYGYARAALAVEAVNTRVRVTARAGPPPVTPRPNGAAADRDTGEVFIAGAARLATFVARDALGAGETVAGPAVIEEATATTVVPLGWTARMEPTGDLMLTRSR